MSTPEQAVPEQDPLAINLDEVLDEVSRGHAGALVDLAAARIAIRKRDARLAELTGERDALLARVGELAGQLANQALRGQAG